MYTEQELVAVAKRENNTKRPYLVVNRLQGKHIPASPGKMAAMFQELAKLVNAEYAGEKLLLVGFAETATAIGAAVAAEMECSYIQTTREILEGAEYLYFSESHSHATEQKLVKDDMDQVMGAVDRIIFIEDEVTTGNTILNIIEILEREYNGHAAFAVASLLNGMDRQAEERYREKGIATHYLVKTDHSLYGGTAEQYRGDGVYIRPQPLEGCQSFHIQTYFGAMNARRLVKSSEYQAACRALWEELKSHLTIERGSRILVLGTEEFMYPAMYAAVEIEKAGCEVRFHATTRSPIAVSSEPGYPLHTRYELRSMYDENRVIYLYDLCAYDQVVIITDAADVSKAGQASLTAALEMKGNQNITLVKWCEG